MLDCSPHYAYRPTSFVAGDPPSCIASVYSKHRSRLTILDPLPATSGLFFRSVEQGLQTNLLAIELTISGTFTVYNNLVINRQYVGVTLGPGGIADLRSLIINDIITNPPAVIEMPTLSYDVHDTTRITEDDVIIGLTPFPLTPLTGGEGPPIDISSINAIRTGPDRTMGILQTHEKTNGSDDYASYITIGTVSVGILSPTQWNGIEWIDYIPNSDCINV